MTPRTLRFTIPGQLPGLNEIVAANRSNRMAGHRQKADAQAFIAPFVPRPITTLRSPVAVTIIFHEKDERRDADNIVAGGVKFILDTLVALKVLQGDGRRHIIGAPDSDVATDRKNPRIEVTVSEQVNGRAR